MNPIDDGLAAGEARQRGFNELLADAILKAHEGGKAIWELTRGRERWSLNVGRLLVLGLSKEEAWIACDPTALGTDVRARVEKIAKRKSEFKSARGITLYVLTPADLLEHRQALMPGLEEAIRRGAHTAKQTPYRAYHSEEAVKEVERVTGRTLPRPEYSVDEDAQDSSVQYWKVAPGRSAEIWEACRDGGYIAVGWSEIGSLEGLTREEFERRAQEAVERYEGWTRAGTRQVWHFSQIPEGSCIIANKGMSEIIGIGRVIGAYYYVSGEKYSHRLPVEWLDDRIRPVDEKGWVRTVIRLNGRRFDAIAGIEGSMAIDKPFLTQRAFELLAGLHQNPTREHFDPLKEEFKTSVKNPLQRLLKNVAAGLPARMRAELETSKRLFGNFLKNDWGQGGTWDFYWGALYPNGGRRTADAQLYVSINHECLEYGFSIGEYGGETVQQIAEGLREIPDEAREPFEAILLQADYLLGERESLVPATSIESLEGWASFIETHEEATVRVRRSKSDVMVTPMSRLVSEIRDTFVDLYPLFRLAVLGEVPVVTGIAVAAGEPSPGGFGEQKPVTAEYSRADLIRETGFGAGQLDEWCRIIYRKRQVILQGPPGTGKTYLAERLARLLISGTSGIQEVLQFHPSYTYEDFIQGIRPEAGNGGLTFKLVEGRFLTFCRRAGQCGDSPCVLILDEINRANLARVFGELMFLLEYRHASINLALGEERFQIPENVYLIGTMNTADRSIARMDHALRRRFSFIRLQPDYGILGADLEKNGHSSEGLIGTLRQINQTIDDPNFELGISYFMKAGRDLKTHLPDIWRCEIEPYLEEFFYDQLEKVRAFRWEALITGQLKEWA